MQKKGFIQSVKGKIIVAAVLACLALFMAWTTSREAFSALLTAFENVSAPNQKLRLVNELSQKIASPDLIQKARLMTQPLKYDEFLKETRELGFKIDTLKSFYTANLQQVKRLITLKKLLKDRDHLFMDYLTVRAGLVDNKEFSAQVQSLNKLLTKKARQVDSLVTTTEKKTYTTTVYPAPEQIEQADSRGFLQKIFGKKKPEPARVPYQVVNEELNVKQDTIARMMKDSLMKDLGQNMRQMELLQQKKSALFVNREAVLINSTLEITQQIVTILKQVEIEGLIQADANNKSARGVVNASIKRISLIMLAFLAASIMLLYFILTDISRINRYRQAVEQAREEAEYHAEAKHRFLSNMSHEIRTPLQSIIGYAEKIRYEDRPGEKDLESIYHSAEHLMQIVNEVLDYNRIISGKFTFVDQPFDLPALLTEIMAAMHPQAEKKEIALNTSYEGIAVGLITGDPFRLKQVLYNLLGNAIKFTDNGHVTLTATGVLAHDTLNCTFAVMDTGPGISAGDMDRIFTEFEQVNDARGNHSAGTGLGLTIAKQLVENQGGHIAVSSQPGEGSTFSFDLKFAKATAAVNNIETMPALQRLAGAGKVWLVDDDGFIRDLCAGIFAKNQVEYRCFGLPSEILNTPWDSGVKYLLLDIRMAEMSGITLCQILRKQVPADVLIYALTAQVMPEAREAILAEGFDGMLMKPFREHELLSLIGKKAASTEFSLTAVEKMTFGDHQQTDKILASFSADSLDDIKALHGTLQNPDIETMVLILHRIAGRSAQLGARKISQDFRLAEMELDRGNSLTAHQRKNILSLTGQLTQLVASVQATRQAGLAH